MSSTTASPIDPRAKRWSLLVRYGALLGVGFLVAPYVFTAITGLLGLIAAGAIMLGTWMVLPAVGAWAGNMRLKLVKAETAWYNDLNEEAVWRIAHAGACTIQALQQHGISVKRTSLV